MHFNYTLYFFLFVSKQSLLRTNGILLSLHPIYLIIYTEIYYFGCVRVSKLIPVFLLFLLLLLLLRLPTYVHLDSFQHPIKLKLTEFFWKKNILHAQIKLSIISPPSRLICSMRACCYLIIYIFT